MGWELSVMRPQPEQTSPNFGSLEAAKSAFEKDFEEAIKHLPDDIQDDLMDELSDLDDIDYWWELREAVGLQNGGSK